MWRRSEKSSEICVVKECTNDVRSMRRVGEKRTKRSEGLSEHVGEAVEE